MGELYAYGSKVTSVFQLIGMLEDDITKSIAWALCNCPVFLKKIIDNPVYMGKIAYGRRRTEKKTGTRNEMHVVEQLEFPVYEGIHEAIISEEDWNLAQEKRSKNNYKREKIHDPEHAHILSGILKCPCCGKGMYGNS